MVGLPAVFGAGRRFGRALLARSRPGSRDVSPAAAGERRQAVKASELSGYIGRFFFVPDGGVAYLVRCDDAAHLYGSVRLLVTPVAGKGSRWVKLASVKPAPDQEGGA